MKDFNWTQFWVTAVICVLLAGFIGYAIAPDAKVVVDQDAIDSAVDNATTGLQDKIDELELAIADYENQTEEDEEEIVIELEGYVIDGIFLTSLVNETLSDREVSLFDGEVEFDGKDYDAEEVFTLTGLKLLANVNDFEGVPYLTILEEAISYMFEFETGLNTNEINDEETLVFNLLGKEVTISEWSANSITFSQGEVYELVERGGITIDEKDVVLDWVLEDAVYVIVDGVGKKILEGSTKTVNGLEIRVSEVLYTSKSTRESKAVLVIGEEVGFEVSDGEEYAEDSIWEWVITPNSIGLVLVEEFTELDEDYNALAPGESVCLPNDYLCVVYDGVIEEDSEVYSFELDTRKGFEYVRVDGNFQFGTSDTSRIYINISDTEYKVYNKDWEVITKDIELGDSDLVILENEHGIFIEDHSEKIDSEKYYLVWINLGLTQIHVDWNGTIWNNITSEDENFLTNYGILVENPEDSCEHQEFEITVPEQKLEATITVE